MTKEEFVASLTPEDEYWIGYLRADGCIGRSKFTASKVLHFRQKHKEPVEAFAKYIGARGVNVADGSGFDVVAISYVCTCANKARLYDDMGLKTEELPSDLFKSPHFWRGMIDGDGTVAIYRYPRLQFVGTDFDVRKFIDFVGDYGIPAPFSVHSTIYRSVLCCKKAAKAIEIIYGSGFSHLNYKREMADKIRALWPQKVREF